MGSSESVPVTETKVDYIPGYLYITNKRIIFTSQKGGLEKSIGSLSAFHPYSNAIGLQFGQKCGFGSTNASNYDVNHRKGIAIWEI